MQRPKIIPLISHTAVDILTSLTGVYGEKFGVPVGSSFGLFNPATGVELRQAPDRGYVRRYGQAAG